MRNRVLFWITIAAFLSGGGYTVVKACCGGPTCPPLTVSVSCDPDTLWPPNHKMVPITLDIQTNSPNAPVVEVVSNEPVNGTGDGDTEPDWVIDGTNVSLNAERAGNGDGRVYTITVTVTDPCGARATAACYVNVPHSQSKTNG